MIFCNRHGSQRVDVPGAGDFQLYAVAASYFNEKDNFRFEKLRKINEVKEIYH